MAKSKKSGRNAHGSGSIRQRSNGKWEARFTYVDEYGVTKRRSLYADTEKEARKKLTAALKAVDDGTYSKPQRMTVAEWMSEWVTVYCADLKPNTICTYESRIEKDIVPFIGAVQLAQLKNPQVQRLINALLAGDDSAGRKPLASKTVCCVHGILHKALEQAKAAGLIVANPSDNVKLPKIAKPELMPLVDASLSAFLHAAQGKEFERVYIVALFTGLRQSEVIGLQWRDIDWTSGVISVRRQYQRNLRGGGYRLIDTTKSSKSRKVTAAPGVLRVLRAEQRHQNENRLAAGSLWNNPAGFIFTDSTGVPVKHGSVYKQYKRIVKSIGMEKSRFHDLRHSYAINALAAGDSIKAIADNLGHYSSAFTMDVYGDTSEAMRRHSQEVIQRLMDEAAGQ